MTEAAKTDGIFNFTQPSVMTFPVLFEAKAFKKNGKETGEPKFKASFLLPKDSDDLKAMKTLAAKLARIKWPDRPFSELLFPFASGDAMIEERRKKGKDDSEHLHGMVVLTAKSKYEPRLAYVEKNKIIDLETDTAKLAAKGKFYPGVEVLAQVNFVAYDGVGQNKSGVTAYLNMVLSTCKGARLSGGQVASEAFKGYVGSVSAEDPTAPGAGGSIDDELPF